jgi:threonine/homoserine/homoserine lactone efflux protein
MSLAFLLTSLVIVATPGTGALFTVSAGISGGARRSLIAAVGCTLGIVPHLAAAITGTAALLHASGVAFQVVKLLGVLYLLVMAWSTWRDKTAVSVDDQQTANRAPRVIGSAILVNLLNPKLTLFFFAFLPQFVPNHGGGQLAGMLALSGVFMAMTLIVFAGYGLFAAAAREHLIARPRVMQRMRRLFAVSFVALGAKLAATNR